MVEPISSILMLVATPQPFTEHPLLRRPSVASPVPLTRPYHTPSSAPHRVVVSVFQPAYTPPPLPQRRPLSQSPLSVPPLGSPVFLSRVSSSATTLRISSGNFVSTRPVHEGVRVSERRPIPGGFVFERPLPPPRPSQPAVSKNSPLSSDRTSSSDLAVRTCRLSPQAVAELANSARSEISTEEEQHVRRCMAEEFDRRRSEIAADVSEEEFVDRKLQEFRHHAAVGGVLWTRQFKWAWLKAEDERNRQNDEEEPDVVRFY